VHDASLLCADAAPRVLVLQPSNLVVLISSPSLAAFVFSPQPFKYASQVWGSKKFELQPSTSAARSHGVFHDRIKTLYSVFESSKKGMDLPMTACVACRSTFLLIILQHDSGFNNHFSAACLM